MRTTNAASRWLLLLILLAAVVPLVAQGATLTHTHERGKPGLYNQEHDFSLYAVSGAAALPEAATVIVAIVLTVSICIVAPRRPARIAYAAADPRAPPAR
jgi:hypothetical protein